ncbi:MAG: DUF6268 family outer membrane beta-barrel protein [Planctomycetota bacterium]
MLAAPSSSQESPRDREAAGQQRKLDVDTGDLFAPPRREDRARLVQDDDQYGVGNMFHRLHGSFVQNAFAYRPDIELSYHFQRETTVKSDPGDFDFQQFRGRVSVPFVLDPDHFLTIGGTAQERRYNFSSNAPVPGDEDLFRFNGEIGFGWFLDDDWLLQATFRPGVYSDTDGTLNHRDWQFFGDLLASWRIDEKVFFSFGATYDETFDNVRVYPVIGLTWHICDVLRFDMMLPKKAELSWIPSAEWIFSTGVSIEGDEYNLRAPGTKQQYNARVQEIEGYVKAMLRVNDNFALWGRVGTTLAGQYDWSLNQGVGTPSADLNGALNAGAFFEAGIGLSF